jgi:hypothetical protein
MCDTVTGPRRAGHRPRWAALYAVTLPQLATLALVEAASPSGAVRMVARVMLTLAAFVGIAWWQHGNRAELDLQEWCECAPRTITVRVIESHRPEPSPRLEPAERATIEADELVHV